MLLTVHSGPDIAASVYDWDASARVHTHTHVAPMQRAQDGHQTTKHYPAVPHNPYPIIILIII